MLQAPSKRVSKQKQCGKVLEAVEESEFKRKLLAELIQKISVGLCFSALRHAAQEAKLIKSILQHVDGSRSLVRMQMALMAWRDIILHRALQEAHALDRCEQRRLRLLQQGVTTCRQCMSHAHYQQMRWCLQMHVMVTSQLTLYGDPVAVYTHWNKNAHEQGQHRRHVGQSLATIALNMLKSSVRHWQLVVAQHNFKFQASSVGGCFRSTRLKMAAFHAWCQNTAERCRTRANQQTVLRALRLASENVPVLSRNQEHQKASVPVFVAQFQAPW